MEEKEEVAQTVELSPSAILESLPAKKKLLIEEIISISQHLLLWIATVVLGQLQIALYKRTP